MSLPIPVGVSNTGINYVSAKSITLKELMRIKDICRNHPSDHFCAIHNLGIKINESKEIEVFCCCGRSHKKLLEEQGLLDFIQKDIKKRQLCRLSTFSSGERLLKHVVNE